ncbi:hypothetical protein [Kordia sp.]|uniref:hypothetical protein n=1 Tax=Kordia sp. TaxID=1965332 RepID=UPI003D6AF852
MKKILFFISLLITFQSFSQNKEKFKPGVKVTTIEKVAEYQKPTSVLFIFEGDTHLVNYFLDLEKHIQRRFKKDIGKGFKLDFIYELTSEKPLESDLVKLPRQSFDKTKYEAIGYITLADFKSVETKLGQTRKQRYAINVELKNKDSDQLLYFILNVRSFKTIVTQNKKSSKLIYKHIMEL